VSQSAERSSPPKPPKGNGGFLRFHFISVKLPGEEWLFCMVLVKFGADRQSKVCDTPGRGRMYHTEGFGILTGLLVSA
jgi:hypothetical protein